MSDRITSAVILAGGEGTRLRPITDYTPKPLVPICGQPCIHLLVRFLQKHGVEKIYITLGYKSELIKRSFEESDLSTGLLRFIEEPTPLGTAGSIIGLKDLLDDDFIVICGDCVCDFDLSSAIKAHKESSDIATVLLSRADDPREYGVAVTAGTRITRFVEKPAWSRVYSDIINTGIYIFKKDIFAHIHLNKEGKCDFAKDVFPILFDKKVPINSFTLDGYWMDIGDRKNYLKANIDVLSGKLSGVFRVNDDILSRKIIPPCVIGKNVHIGDSVVGPYAVIGDNSVIGNGCRMVSSVLLESVTVDDGVEMRDAIVCSGSKISNGVTVDKGSVIAYNCNIGEGSVIAAESVLYSENSVPGFAKVSGCVKKYTDSSELECGKLVFENVNCEQDCLKAGNSFGRTVRKYAGKQSVSLAVGVDDGCGDSRFFALISGITASGCGVYNTGVTGKSPLRYIIRKFHMDGGVCISETEERGKKDTVITFYDKDGVVVSREKERGIAFYINDSPESVEPRGYFKQFNGFGITFNRYIRFLLDVSKYGPKPLTLKSFVFAPGQIQEEIKCSADEKDEKIVIGQDFITVYPQVDNENDPRTPFPQEYVDIILSFVIGIQTGCVVIPYRFPFVCDLLGKTYGYEVKRATVEDELRPELYYITDGSVSGALLLRYLSIKDITFTELCEIIPSHGSQISNVSVSAKNIGKIMLSLVDNGMENELVEGIKIFLPDKNGTVLITPEKQKKTFRIYAESLRSETAEELCGMYKEIIENKDRQCR